LKGELLTDLYHVTAKILDLYLPLNLYLELWLLKVKVRAIVSCSVLANLSKVNARVVAKFSVQKKHFLKSDL